MSKSKRKIKEGVQVREFRKKNKITNCQCCGVRLGNMCHHYLCNKCWNVEQKKPLEWKHYFKTTHEKYYEKNCEKWTDTSIPEARCNK